MRPAVLVTRRLPAAALTLLEEHATVDMHAGEKGLTPGDLQERLRGKQGVVVLLGDRLDRAAIDAGTDLKVIANVAVGYDNLDVGVRAYRRVLSAPTRPTCSPTRWLTTPGR